MDQPHWFGVHKATISLLYKMMNYGTDREIEPNLLIDVEKYAAELATSAGEILSSHFGTDLDVSYKDVYKNDPVTSVDIQTQEYLVGRISERFPDHGIVGEEGLETDDGLSPDIIWVIDPLDGTKNFIGGLPIFACSIGILYRGEPVAGALYLPWPGKRDGVIAHARRGGGAYIGEERVVISGSDKPFGNRLVGLPSSFNSRFQFGSGMNGRIGELRISGSIAYEMVLVAKGILQYSVVGAPRLWDVLGGIVLVEEAGGTVLVGVGNRPHILPGRRKINWLPARSALGSWANTKPKISEIRHWRAPLIIGGSGVSHVAANLDAKRRLGW